MGGDPWMYRAPYEPDAKTGVTKYEEEILDKSEDWPTVSVGKKKDECTLTPLGKTQLERFFKTSQPTAEMVERCYKMWKTIDAGHGYYFILYDDGKPFEFCFVGYSIED